MRDITLVTGASGGIGVALALGLSRRGRQLALTARDEAKLRDLALSLGSPGGEPAIVVPADLAKPHAADAILATIAAAGGRVNELVNNAGFGLTGEAAALPRDEQVGMIDLDVRALVDLTLACLPGIVAARGGILNVASTAAFAPGPGMAVYYASKAFVLSFSEALHQELRPAGVRVTALCPGPTRTGFQARARSGPRRLDAARPMEPDTVAEAGLDGFLRGRRVVVPGAGNRIAAALAPLLPRALLLPAMARLQRPRSRG